MKKINKLQSLNKNEGQRDHDPFYDTANCELPDHLGFPVTDGPHYAGDSLWTENYFGLDFSTLGNDDNASFEDGNATNLNGSPFVDSVTTAGDRELLLKNMSVDIDVSNPMCENLTGFKMDITQLNGDMQFGINENMFPHTFSNITDLNGIIWEDVRINLDGITGLNSPGDITMCPMTADRPLESVQIGALPEYVDNEIINNASLALDNLTRVECGYLPIDIAFTPPNIPPDIPTWPDVPLWDFFVENGDWSPWSLTGWWPPSSPDEVLRPHYTNWGGRYYVSPGDDYQLVVQNPYDTADLAPNWYISYGYDDTPTPATPVGGHSSGSASGEGHTISGTITIEESGVCCMPGTDTTLASCQPAATQWMCEEVWGGNFGAYATCEEAFAANDENFVCSEDICTEKKINWDLLESGSITYDDTGTFISSDQVYFANDITDDTTPDFTADGPVTSGGIPIRVESLPAHVVSDGSIGNYVQAGDCTLSLFDQEMMVSAAVLDFMFPNDLDWLHMYVSTNNSGPFYVGINEAEYQTAGVDIWELDSMTIGGVDISVHPMPEDSNLFNIHFGDISTTAINSFAFGGAQPCLGDVCYKEQDDEGGHHGTCEPADYEDGFIDGQAFNITEVFNDGHFEIEVFSHEGSMATDIPPPQFIIVEQGPDEEAPDDILVPLDEFESNLRNVNAQFTLDPSITTQGIAMDFSHGGNSFDVGTLPSDIIHINNVTEFNSMFATPQIVGSNVEISVAFDTLSSESTALGTITWCTTDGTNLDSVIVGGQEVYTDNTRCVLCHEDFEPGDLNEDGTINILDIVHAVNQVLTGDGMSGDLNDDGTVNVLDIVLLVNIVLDFPLREEDADDGVLGC